jgi:Zn-dependent protease
LLSVAVLAIPWHIAFSFIPLPLPPFEDITLSGKIALLFCYVLGTGILVNLMLAVFNMLPIHPLDGSGVLEGLLPKSWSEAYARMRPYGFIILLVLFYLPAFGRLIWSVVGFLGGIFRVQFFSLQGIW